jgi:hypothetical protein
MNDHPYQSVVRIAVSYNRAVALAWEVCGLGQREIRREFGVGPHAVSTAIAQTAARRREASKIGRALKRLTSIFKG